MSMTDTTIDNPPKNHNLMSDAEFDKRRTDLGADDKAEAGIRFEQNLSILYAESGWSQQKIAEREEASQSHVSRHILFGHFLSHLTPTGVNNVAPKLTERLFREFWVETEGSEEQRYEEVADMVAKHEESIARAIGKAVKEGNKTRDGKWRSFHATVARILEDAEEVGGADEFHAERYLRRIIRSQPAHTKLERKKMGRGADREKKETSKYRLFPASQAERVVSVEELTERLGPELDLLETQGKEHTVKMDPSAVLHSTLKIRKMIEEWSQ
jgi:hypothetical protein